MKHDTITEALDSLSRLVCDDFHGYRSEVYSVLSQLYDKAIDEGLPVSPEVPGYSCIDPLQKVREMEKDLQKMRRQQTTTYYSMRMLR